jgi:hypothetical protein
MQTILIDVINLIGLIIILINLAQTALRLFKLVNSDCLAPAAILNIIFELALK